MIFSGGSVDLKCTVSGTDGEQELIKACRSVFGEAIGLRCLMNFQKNLETPMKNCCREDQVSRKFRIYLLLNLLFVLVFYLYYYQY